MKLISWNVNGLRACLQKGFLETFQTLDADIFCLQETKLQHHAGQVDLDLPGYHQFWNSAEKKGYSGVAVFTKAEPLSVTYGLGLEDHDHEGRVITAEYPGFYLVCCYTPNSQNELRRLDYRMTWEDDFRAYLQNLDENKPVILCGDLNVAATEIDLKNPKANRRNAGFTDEERETFQTLLSATSTPTWRGPIPGGATASTPGRRTRGGGLTTSWSPTACCPRSPGRPSTARSTAATTARWSWGWSCNCQQKTYQRYALFGVSLVRFLSRSEDHPYFRYPVIFFQLDGNPMICKRICSDSWWFSLTAFSINRPSLRLY